MRRIVRDTRHAQQSRLVDVLVADFGRTHLVLHLSPHDRTAYDPALFLKRPVSSKVYADCEHADQHLTILGVDRRLVCIKTDRDRLTELLHRIRLRKAGDGAEFHGFSHLTPPDMAGDRNDRCLGFDGLHDSERVVAREPRHCDIEDNECIVLFNHPQNSFDAICRNIHRVAVGGDLACHEICHNRLVINYEYDCVQ